MCCIGTLFLVILSRLGIVIWWIANPQSHNLPYATWILPGGLTLPAWLWTVIGGLLIPWTTLAYLIVYPGGIVGTDWIILGVALLVDLAGHGGTYRHRSRFYRNG